MAQLEIIAKLKNMVSPEAKKVEADMQDVTKAVGEADAKVVTLTQSEGKLAQEMGKLSQETTKAKTDVLGMGQAIGEADIKSAAFAQRQRMLAAEMNKFAKEVATGKITVAEATQKFADFESKLAKIEAPEIPKVTSNVEELTKAVGEADIKAAALTQRQSMLSAEMNRLAKEVATGKTTVAEATQKYAEFEKTLGKNDDVVRKSKLSWTELNQALELVEKGFNAVKAVGRELYETIGEGAKIQAAQNTFENLAESINTTSESLMGGLHQSTMGMVSDADLMVAANRFVAMGLANTQEEANNLANVATQLGVAFRGDAVVGMEELALMLANQSIPRLDSFGVSAGKVRSRINELMTTQAGMTRETAFMQAFMEQAGVTMEKIGPQGSTAAAGLARVESAVKNMGDEVKATVADEFAPLMERLATDVLPQLADVVSSNVVPAVSEVVGLFGDITNDGSSAESQINNLGDAFDALTESVQTLREIRNNISDTSRVMRIMMQDGQQIKELLGIGFTFAGNAVDYFSSILDGDGQGALRAYNAQARELHELFGGLPIVGALLTKAIESTTAELETGTEGTQRFTKEVKDETAALKQEADAVVASASAHQIRNKHMLDVARSGKDAVALAYQGSDAYAEWQDKIAQGNAILTENEAKIAAANAATKAKEEADRAAADAVEQHRQRVEAYNRTLGDYFAEAAEGGSELELFTHNLDQLGESTYTVSNLTEQQTADLERMQTAYDKAAQTIRDYELGVKGANMTDEERNKKIEEQQAIMATLSANMQPLLDAGTTLASTNNALTISTSAVNQELYSMIAAGDGSAASIAAAGLALGIFDEKAAEAYLKTAVLKIELEKLAQAYSAGDISLQTMMTGMQSAIQEVNDMSLSDATGSVNLFDESTIVATTDTESLINKMGEVPSDIDTVIDLDTGRAVGAISEYINRLNAIPNRVVTQVEVHGGEGVTAHGGYQNPEGRSSGGRVKPFNAYFVGDAPGGGITPYTELFIPDQPGFVVNNDTLQRLMGSSGGGGSSAAAPFVPEQPLFGGGAGGSQGTSIQITNQFNTPVSRDMIGMIEAATKRAAEQALAERDRRASSTSRMRG